MKNKVVYKATRADISMNVDTGLQKKILKTIAWSLGLGTAGIILLINFLFFFAETIAEKISQLGWNIRHLIA